MRQRISNKKTEMVGSSNRVKSIVAKYTTKPGKARSLKRKKLTFSFETVQP